MKKSLLAVAAMTAFAGAAQAQSSVTVYGILDMGFGGSSSTQAGPAMAGPVNGGGTTNGNTVTKTQTSGFGGSGETTSRIGFKGNEDLGGGASAFFTAEAALATDNAGAGIFTNSTGTSNRQMFVGLGKKGIGQGSIGLQYTPVHEAVAVTDAGGTNNANGNVIYDRTGGMGTASVDYGTGQITNPASGMSTNTSYTVRTTNALVLKSEVISGFQAKALLTSGGKDTNATTAGQTVANSGYGIGLNYSIQKAFVTANWQQFDNETANSNTFTPGYAGAAITPGVNTKDQQGYLAATYDFGILKAYVQYISRKVTNTNNNNNYVSRTAEQIGIRSSLTPKVTAWASAGMGRINNTGTNGPTANFNGWQLGTDYALSKRTNLYAIYGQTATSNATSGLYGGSTTYAAQSSANASSYALGVRHTF